MQTDTLRNLRAAVARGDVYLPDAVRQCVHDDVDGWQNGIGAMVGEVHYLARPHYANDDAWQHNQRALQDGRLGDVDRDAALSAADAAAEASASWAALSAALASSWAALSAAAARASAALAADASAKAAAEAAPGADLAAVFFDALSAH